MAFFKKKLQEDLEIPPPPIKPAALSEIKLPETPDELPSFEELRGKELPPLPPPAKLGIAMPKPEVPHPPTIQKPEIQHPPIPQIPKREPVSIPHDIKSQLFKRYEQEQYEEEKEEITELEKRDYTGKPLYILISQYKHVLAEVNEARNILKTAEENVMNLNTIKNKTDKEFGAWRQAVEDMQRRIIFIDKTLFER